MDRGEVRTKELIISRLLGFGWLIVFVAGVGFGWWSAANRRLSGLPQPVSVPRAVVPSPEETIALAREEGANSKRPGWVKLGATKESVVVLYDDLERMDALDEQGASTVKSGTYARVLSYQRWNDSAHVEIKTGASYGDSGYTLRTNLRKLMR